MPWPDTTFTHAGQDVNVMHALGDILQKAAGDPGLDPIGRTKVARLVGLCMLRAYATSKTDAYLANKVMAAWIAAQQNDWPATTQEINDNDLFADTV